MSFHSIRSSSLIVLFCLCFSLCDAETHNDIAAQNLYEMGYEIKDSFKAQLIAKGLNPDNVDKGGNSLLHRLAKSKNLELMRAALEEGLDPYVYNSKQETPLSIAIKNKDLEIMQLIQEYCPETTVQQSHRSYVRSILSSSDIVTAAKLNWKEGLEFLFSANPEVVENRINAHNEKGITPFHYACAHSSSEIIQLFITYGADVNSLTHSEYRYGPQDPHNWSQRDQAAWAEFGNLQDLDKYRSGSGYLHPVVSPLAIISKFHYDETDLIELFRDLGAVYVYHNSVKNEYLGNYIK